MSARLLALAPLLLLAGGDPWADGVRAYEAGHFDDALAAFSAAEQEAGDHAPAALLQNRALAALRAGELRIAELTAEKAAARGGPALFGFRDFVIGSAAFVRCARAEAEAGLTGADPTALGRAVAHAEAARDAWRQAAMRGADWPEARRNAERAQRALERLSAQQAAAERDRRVRREAQPQLRPEPQPSATPPPGERIDAEVEPAPQQDPDVLSAQQLAAVLDRLAQIEREKRQLRELRQRARTALVEKDW